MARMTHKLAIVVLEDELERIVHCIDRELEFTGTECEDQTQLHYLLEEQEAYEMAIKALKKYWEMEVKTNG